MSSTMYVSPSSNHSANQVENNRLNYKNNLVTFFLVSRRAVLPRAGLPAASKNLYIGETDKPIPKEGEILVKGECVK